MSSLSTCKIFQSFLVSGVAPFDESAVAGVFLLLIVCGRAAVAGDFLLWVSFSTPTIAEVVYSVLPLRVVDVSVMFLVIFLFRVGRG